MQRIKKNQFFRDFSYFSTVLSTQIGFLLFFSKSLLNFEHNGKKN